MTEEDTWDQRIADLEFGWWERQYKMEWGLEYSRSFYFYGQRNLKLRNCH